MEGLAAEENQESMWIGEKRWHARKALADSLDRTAAQLVREAIDLLLKKYGAK
jgi:hypothetical protein